VGNRFFRKVGKLLIFSVAIGYIIIWAVILYTMPDGYGKYLELKEKKQVLLAEKEYQLARMERIKKESEMLKTSSPFFVEMIARERLNMAKKGETIIKFKNNE